MKKIIFATLVCFFIISSDAYAHTGLKSSNPENGSTVTEALNEISLIFETKIEKTSSFKLLNATNEEIEVTNISIGEYEMIGTVDNSIENGSYTIQWKIIGVDGHPIEGEVPFILNAPVLEDTRDEVVPEVETEDTETAIEETTPEDTPEENSTEVATTEAEVEEDSSNSTTVVLMVGLFIILAISVWWLLRRKNK